MFRFCLYADVLHGNTDLTTSERHLIYDQIRPTRVPAGLVEAMRMLWTTYVHRGRDQLLGLGQPRVLRPVFDEAFAIGDAVLGSSLIDVKTHEHPNLSLEQFLNQVLAYALLDDADRFGIESVGIYLSWHGHLLTQPLNSALEEASGQAAHDLGAARREFHRIVAPALEEARLHKRPLSAPHSR